MAVVHIALSEQHSFNIAEVIEYKQGMITGITEMAVVGRAFLSSECWTVRTVHVQNDLFDGSVLVNFIHALTRLVHWGF